ncbi:MAG TPA: glycosyltransferase family 2 protein [Nitrososphaeraceae archaeon]|nr:glycosyltransferase family 2 protein [Nitrososphaeraceae archaeon]
MVLTSPDVYPVILSLLIILFIVIIVAWIFLFTISIRSHLHTPLIIRKRHDPTKQHSNNLPLVSVIVPARNEQDNIQRCLLSLLAQNYPSFEVIVVNDSSTDYTPEIVRKIKISRIKQKEGGDKSLDTDRLKIITVTEKPEKWTGKTWASEQGYSHSTGNILLFTDADTYYMRKDTIYEAVSYMQDQELDVLTGIGFIELRDFWSKVTMPLWNLFSILLGSNTGAMNDPKSKVAYLVGSFFLIRRQVLEEIGTFRSVKNAIGEDAELGLLLKSTGYSMKIVRIDNGISGLWSRDLQTLWNGIKRTFAPMKRWKIFTNLMTVFFMTFLPFLLLPYTFLLAIALSNAQLSGDNSIDGLQLLQLASYSFYLNLTSCLIVIMSTALKDIKKHRITPIYSLLSFLGAGFIIISYIASIFSIFLKQSIPWRGRASHISNNKTR